MTNPSVTRRQFTMSLAGGAAFSAAQSAAADQESSPKNSGASQTSADNSVKKSEMAADGEPDETDAGEPPPEAAYLLGLIMRRYPDERIDDAAVAGIVRDIYGDLSRSRIINSFPLSNSDEPGFLFRAWRAD